MRTLNALARKNLVQVSGFTPSDAGHVLGLQDNWSAEAPRQAARPPVRQRGRGGPAPQPTERRGNRDDPFGRMEPMARPPLGAITRPLDPGRFDGRHIVDFPYKANGRGFTPNRREPREFEASQIWVRQLSGDTTRRMITNAPYSHRNATVSPDGRWIFFNSVRTGTMQIWRMDADGGNQEQITFDEYNDWFPHPSPDGRWLVFLSYEPGVEGHPANRNVMLRIMPMDGGEPRALARLFGGQGTINVPSWSPDSRRVAFVSYRLVGQ